MTEIGGSEHIFSDFSDMGDPGDGGAYPHAYDGEPDGLMLTNDGYDLAETDDDPPYPEADDVYDHIGGPLIHTVRFEDEQGWEIGGQPTIKQRPQIVRPADPYVRTSWRSSLPPPPEPTLEFRALNEVWREGVSHLIDKMRGKH